MKQTVDLYTFRRAFQDAGRTEQFTHEGQEVLFNFLEEMERDTGEESELDVIALCCDFYESSPEEIAQSYDVDLSECETDEERMNTCLDYLSGETTVAGHTSGSIVYQAF